MPIYSKARQVPLRLQPLVCEELDRLVAAGIITQIFSSDWSSPTVSVIKPDGSLRLSADFSTTVNKYIKPVNSPLVTIDEAILSIGKARVFSKLDLKQAFLQLPVHDDSKQYLVINSPYGLFRYTYLPFGLTSSPGIFQSFISKILSHIPGVLCYQDDILVLSHDQICHENSLREVLI